MSIDKAQGLGHGTKFQGRGFTLTDHRSDVVTGACPHTAFKHPLTPAGVAPRHNIELRALAWYEDCA